MVGLLLVVFPGPIGIAFCRIGKWTWRGHENDLVAKVREEMTRAFPAFSWDYEEAKAPRKVRFLGLIFLIQAGMFFVLSAFR